MDGEFNTHGDSMEVVWGERQEKLETPAMLGNNSWVKSLHVGPWNCYGSNHALMMSEAEVNDLLGRYAGWAANFARDKRHMVPQNLAEQRFGLPSMLVRVDYVWDPLLRVCRIFEFDDRPAGIGVTQHINKVARDGFERIFASWQRVFGKKLAVCISEDRMGTNDDPVWAAHLSERSFYVHHGMPPELLRERYIWWPRVSRHESMYYPLTSNSLSTIELEGDKSYGVAMGMWHEIRNPADIPLHQGCVLKPKAGSRFEETVLVKAKSERNRAGYISPTKALEIIHKGKVHYWQPLYPPEGADVHRWLPENYSLMRRAYIAAIQIPASADGGQGTDGICCIGGTWLAGPGDRLHGASNSISGPLMVPKAKSAPAYPWHSLAQ